MREIKFRAWDKQQNKWLDGDSLFIDGTGEVFTGEDWCGSCDQAKLSWDCEDNIEITQYTGLKDKNGKEIYEGDIVKVNTFKGVKKGTVIFKNACFWALVKEFNTVSNVLFPLHDNEKYTKFQVIGNIYENPELMEVENE